MSRTVRNPRLRAAVSLGIALLATLAGGVVSIEAVHGYEQRLEGLRAPVAGVTVVIATHDLYPGLPIQADDLIAIDIPAEYAPPGGYATVDALVGRVPKERILGSEFVLGERLADSATGSGLNALIPPGMRGVAVDIANGAQLSGFLTPGDHVDVLVTVTGEDGVRETITLAQDVAALAVDDRTDGAKQDGPQAPSVTLALTPEQAEEVVHAHRKGAITLSMRAAGDCDHVDLRDPVVIPQLAAAPEAQSVELWRATDLDVQPVDEQGAFKHR